MGNGRGCSPRLLICVNCRDPGPRLKVLGNHHDPGPGMKPPRSRPQNDIGIGKPPRPRPRTEINTTQHAHNYACIHACTVFTMIPTKLNRAIQFRPEPRASFLGFLNMPNRFCSVRSPVGSHRKGPLEFLSELPFRSYFQNSSGVLPCSARISHDLGLESLLRENEGELKCPLLAKRCTPGDPGPPCFGHRGQF